MTIQDDETLQMYLEESIEHLADIETDLLGIEEAGADIDEDLVNKVYRAAHSIKGGAGFMGLNTIKDLTHEMENILGKIRSRDMIPTPEIINILLTASDTLKELMNDVFTSNDVDISQHIENLQAVAEGKTPTAAAPQPESVAPQPDAAPAPEPEAEGETTPVSEISLKSDSDQIIIEAADGAISIAAERQQVEDLMNEGKFVYLAQIDLIADVVDKGKSPAVTLEEMEQTGILVACSPPAEEVRTMEIEKGQTVDPLRVLFATILKPEDINVLFEIPEHQIYQVLPDMGLQCLGSPPVETAPVEPVPVEQVVEPAPRVAEPAAAEPVEPPPAAEPEPAVAAAPK
jgi:two-component system chemotaxis sensor kinase CheA